MTRIQPGDQALLDLEHELFALLQRMRRNVAERAAQVEPGLSVLGYVILDLLERDGGRRAVDIACQVNADKGAMSRAVQQLEGLGLIAREVDPSDARAQLLTITDEGSRRIHEVVEARRARFAELIGEWDVEQVNELVQLLGRYNATIEAGREGAR